MTTYPMAVLTEPGRIEYQQKEIPELKANEVLINVKFASICGSDLHLFRGKHPSVNLPSAVGHELSGDIITLGKNVTTRKIGERVTVEPVIACGQCHFCKRGKYHLCENISFQYRKGQGAFGEFFAAPEEHVFKLPDSISYEEGALIEPLSVALHAVSKNDIKLGDTCAIFGAGAIGLLTTMLVSQISQSKCFTVDINGFRLEKALQLGATHALNNLKIDALEAIMQETDHRGVDFAFEAVGNKITLEQALKALKKGGAATVIGIFEEQLPTIPVNLFIQKEISLSGSQGYNWDFQAALNILASHNIKLKPLITHRFPFEELQQAFSLLLEPGNQAIKVLIEL
jgi:2-desacetyl-2-hydroxyethyl bacteriochlorophyllide A dehydrogenase